MSFFSVGFRHASFVAIVCVFLPLAHRYTCVLPVCAIDVCKGAAIHLLRILFDGFRTSKGNDAPPFSINNCVARVYDVWKGAAIHLLCVLFDGFRTSKGNDTPPFSINNCIALCVGSHENLHSLSKA